MDAYEATKVVLERIQAVDPENAAKIMGLLLLQDNGEKEMIRLAFGPDPLLLAAVSKARSHLGLARPAPPLPSPPPPYYDDFHNLSFLNDAASAAAGGGYGWRPCLYFARGYCKNGSSCRFLHGAPDEASALDAAVEQQCHDLLIRSKSQRLMSAAFPYSPTSPVPPSPSSMNKCPSFLLPESQRAAAALMLGSDDPNKFVARSPRMMERSDLAGISNPSARQIYLTFPADSTFREEDVSNYFSNYGPVQDVRIPYQQKRMFGFVTFVFPETVRLILAKGNPHFVCDARVLVKPYKEKGKVPDKYRKQQQGDFSGCFTPTSALDARDTSDLQQLGAVRMLYGGSGLSQEVMLRRRLDELQQAAELQQAIELHSRRFMGLQLLDLKSQSLHSAGSPAITNVGLEEQAPPMLEEKSTATAALPQMAVNSTADKEVEESIKQASSNQVSGFQECADHNLPDSPFASPTKASYAVAAFAAASSESDTASRHNIDGNLLPNANLDMASFKSCFFPLPRFSSGHGAVGM